MVYLDPGFRSGVVFIGIIIKVVIPAKAAIQNHLKN
jgi:hypothetical protein